MERIRIMKHNFRSDGKETNKWIERQKKKKKKEVDEVKYKGRRDWEEEKGGGL